MTTVLAFTKNVTSDQERKLEVRRRSDTALVLTINDITKQSAEVSPMTRRASSGKPKLSGSRGSMGAKLKIKGIDGRPPPGVKPAAEFDSTREISRGPDTGRTDRLRALS